MANGRPGDSLAAEMRRLTDALSRLVRDHLELARTELREEARAWTRDAALGAAGIPFLLAALLLLNVALAVALSTAIGTAWGFAAVGLANLAVGIGLAAAAAGRLRARGTPLPRTAEELERNRRFAVALQALLWNGRGNAASPLPEAETAPGAVATAPGQRPPVA